MDPEDVQKAALLLAHHSGRRWDIAYTMLLTIDGKVLVRGLGRSSESLAYDGLAAAVAQIVHEALNE